MQNLILDIQNIVKQYANHTALDHVSLAIPEGKIFGLLGPNGAGKTSLIRIINQITAPDAGQIFFHNEPLAAKHIGKIGYLPEERGLYKKMKVGEQMIYLAQLKGLSRNDARKRLIYWFDKFDVGSWWNKKIEDLSKGMQQKVQFIATILHEPELIILDEPFSGFDPVNAQVIQEEILALNKKGSTIIYSTHRMETVEEICDNIALINKSKKVLDGSVKAIKDAYDKQSYHIQYANLQETNSLIGENSLFTVQVDDTMNQQIQIKLQPEVRLNEVLAFLMTKVEILQVKKVIPSINDIFIEKVTATDIA
ncbi:ABC transporter ATP-binding protein [Sphingobacterium sp. Mn56C]|uniref:ABC transporter ATP-binding protein n=1 Tax=Sphingobacterium sp. Mn56C TaxID=3395261 RepID=UPI003BDE36CB